MPILINNDIKIETSQFRDILINYAFFIEHMIMISAIFLRRHRNEEGQPLMWRTFFNTVICWVYTILYVYGVDPYKTDI